MGEKMGGGGGGGETLSILPVLKGGFHTTC